MSTSEFRWTETITRGAAIALMSNFTSVAEALKELVDNPIDYRWGQRLTIDISHDKARDVLVVESDGGRGMGAEHVLVWLNWGEGEEHTGSHIGRWHQGGKAACGFLGEHLRLWTKEAGSTDIWLLEDEGWASRREPRDFGAPKPLPPGQVPESMAGLGVDRGHVKLELSNLIKDRAWNLATLKRNLASTYRALIAGDAVEIRINGELVEPLKIPLVPGSARVELNATLPGGLRARGWASKMQRDQLEVPIHSGLRLLFNGRLVRDGEWFGYNHEGKGALNSLVGELTLTGFVPLPNKTDFVSRGDSVWEELSKTIAAQLSPLISDLRGSSEESRVSKQEKNRAQEVAAELEEVFIDAVHDSQGTAATAAGELTSGPGGRLRSTKSEGGRATVRNSEAKERKPQQPRTPPPDDPVGRIARLLEQVGAGSRRPPLRIRSWDSAQRSAWTNDGGRTHLDVNKSYPLYKAMRGDKSYIAETAIFELSKPAEGESMTPGEFLDRANLMLLKWSEVAGVVPTDA